MGLIEPSMDQWLAEAKADPQASHVGMYLTHNGVVRATPRHIVRAEEYTQGASGATNVVAINFSYDHAGLEQALAEARTWDGVYYVRAWLNEGELSVGESIMYVLIGADIRPHALDALNKLVRHIKNDLVTETEIYNTKDQK